MQEKRKRDRFRGPVLRSDCLVLLDILSFYLVDGSAANAEILVGQLLNSDGEKFWGHVHDFRGGLRQALDQLRLLRIRQCAAEI